MRTAVFIFNVARAFIGLLQHMSQECDVFMLPPPSNQAVINVTMGQFLRTKTKRIAEQSN
jgi:hypothetical protein